MDLNHIPAPQGPEGPSPSLLPTFLSFYPLLPHPKRFLFVLGLALEVLRGLSWLCALGSALVVVRDTHWALRAGKTCLTILKPLFLFLFWELHLCGAGINSCSCPGVLCGAGLDSSLYMSGALKDAWDGA